MKTVRDVMHMAFEDVKKIDEIYIIFAGKDMRRFNPDSDMDYMCYYAVKGKDLFDDKEYLTFYCSDLL